MINCRSERAESFHRDYIGSAVEARDIDDLFVGDKGVGYAFFE